MLFEKSDPNIVLMDTKIISKTTAPHHKLHWRCRGRRFEARGCLRSDAGNFADGKAGVASYTIFRACYDTLLTNGPRQKAP